ncbi:pimeloyl-ACP methyl ester carboxylesterase [Lipingzhangella halophila]|uniref:Pimeloyl-ACP methyl ester carboxylesterase n=1 Tax=Lipingzhangella halophila TaxID=1783352 RepID=A0A7W7RJB9_9ACTN|nr:alpha/beta hydrolase [Lipingzhangella halophila]MBB4933039.1 pimeloyl-ACP methyl ester carboxylesterase [Lipingzhangella halophila]
MRDSGSEHAWSEFVDRWSGRCARDPELATLAQGATVGFGLRHGTDRAEFRFSDGRFATGASAATTESGPEFEVSAPPAEWSRFFEAVPRPPYQSFFGMLMRVSGAEVLGDELVFAQHAHLVRRVLELGREAASGAAAPDARSAPADGAHDGDDRRQAAGHDAVTGRYLHLDVTGSRQRVYYETAGSGRDVLFLHTAGADCAQFHHLLANPALRSRLRMVSFDLPWHGKSPPPPGAVPGSYALDTDTYARTVMALVEELGLRQPIVVGASMAGEICLELAYRHPDRLGGVVACEASDAVPGRQVRWALDPRVNQALFVPEWVDGLMAPQSPPEYRAEVWWGYSQGGHGAFYGDILFYSGDWDGRDRVPHIDTQRCPVVMLTGEYDYSCTPEMSRRTAERIPGAHFAVMPELGHFPHAENPPRFAAHLSDALTTIDTHSPKPEPADDHH